VIGVTGDFSKLALAAAAAAEAVVSNFPLPQKFGGGVDDEGAWAAI